MIEENKKIRLKIKKGVKYSICTCSLSNKMPFCDNAHRSYNAKNNADYKFIKSRVDAGTLTIADAD